MDEHLKAIRSVVTELETVQQDIGKSQVELLQVLTDETQDEWDCPAQAALLNLEIVQRTIGDVQISLVEVMPACDHEHHLRDSTPDGPATILAATVPALKPGTSATPLQLLEARGIKIKKAAPPSGLDATADRASLLLGEKFSLLETFYKAVKRRVARNTTSRWFHTSELSREALTEVCDFGNRMKASGFFTEFKFFSKGINHDPDRRPVILFDPLPDHRVKYFFEGGWLERYVFQVLKQEVQKATGTWCQEQFVKGVRIEFPYGGNGELDTLVGLPGDRLLWLECKTGAWQDYIKRFQSINRKFLRIPKEDSALVLVQELDEAEKASAGELTGMTVIHFSELREWLKKAIA